MDFALDQHTVSPRESFDWYRSLREISPLLTSGWGMGTERFLLWVLQQEDVRDLQVFPRLKGMRGGI